MSTGFPLSPEVKLRVDALRPIRSRIRIRVPGWAAGSMPISVNGALRTVGKPGTYVTLDRTWRRGDTVTFSLPETFRLTRYAGAERKTGQERYALEYGPVLMALTGTMDEHSGTRLPWTPQELVKRLKAQPGRSLHFAIEGDAAHDYVPYWEVKDQVFTCYPVVGGGGPEKSEAVGPNDLALAARGATASSDSEYAREPGGTARVIDGIIATPDDFSNRWHSSLETPHPHWIQVKLARPAVIGRIVIRFADPAGHPTSFRGVGRVNGKDQTLFDVTGYTNDRVYEKRVRPVLIDTFRLIIRDSANPAYPNAAQVSEIEIYPGS